jgi:hypothetical protein
VRYTEGVPLGDISFMFAGGCIVLWTVLLAGRNIIQMSARSITSITGYLRAAPDPWFEHAVREALSEFDRELRKLIPRLDGHDGKGPNGRG